MAKVKPTSVPVVALVPDIFAGAGKRDRKYRELFLPRFLAEAAPDKQLEGPAQDRAFALVKKWADLEKAGALLKSKETSLDADFLKEIFVEGLGYIPKTDSHAKYSLERQLAVPGVGSVDGALGVFGTGLPPTPFVMIELKGAKTDLDRDKSNGRTAVQQCWDYLNATPACPWGIVSNFVSIRLYHRDKTPSVYQEFRLQDLRKLDTFRKFYYLFEAGAFLPSPTGVAPRAIRLLGETTNRQRTVGDELYNYYSDNRNRLIEHLRAAPHSMTLDKAIHVAQRILDRILFIAFCEDRALLRPDSIKETYASIPPYTRAVNPRWRAFVELFASIDLGVPGDPFLHVGYNGGLFKHEPDIDEISLSDTYADVFKRIGEYEFRTEVNVEVLGHIFEKSIAELELIRNAGGPLVGGTGETESAMPKSAERKRFGIYYTPQAFTEFIVEKTVGALVETGQSELQKAHNLTANQLDSDKPTPAVAAYWRDCLSALRRLKICDPACGSGAFLIAAYEYLEAHYFRVVEQLARHAGLSEKELAEPVAGYILTENLYGVDLSEQSVEITKLSLWLSSVTPGKKLPDLERNIVEGNSLVSDAAVHGKAMIWEASFPDVFGRENPGFDAVIGNPPWERMKLQEREFFAHSAPEIAMTVNAATRRQRIVAMRTARPELYSSYQHALQTADRVSVHVRQSGQFPLTARGDINTYMLFAELARNLVAPTGRVGLLVPSGISTDHTTREFFASLMDTRALAGLYDFENKNAIFPDVDGRFKFTILLYGGSESKHEAADFVFFAHKMEDLESKKRHVALSAADMALLNPNTKTCPIFRSRRDAELTKAIYRRVPILIDKSRREGGNPWDIKFSTMFHQTNDAELFQSPEQLKENGLKLVGNRWIGKDQIYLPLYEAKMIQSYDHRVASVVIEGGNWMRQGQTEATSQVSHQNPEFVVQPRWWVNEAEVDRVRGGRSKPAYLCYKDVTSATNQRTMIAALTPNAAVVNSAPVMLVGDSITPRLQCCLLGNLNSFALDFVARQKVGGLHLNYFIVEQLPILPPERYAEKCPWAKKQTLEKWISDRVLKLSCTADDMKPLAEAAGFDPPVHKWKADERAEMLAELDAAYFPLYGIDRADAEYILSAFQGMKDESTAAPSRTPPRRPRRFWKRSTGCRPRSRIVRGKTNRHENECSPRRNEDRSDGQCRPPLPPFRTHRIRHRHLRCRRLRWRQTLRDCNRGGRGRPARAYDARPAIGPGVPCGTGRRDDVGAG